MQTNSSLSSILSYNYIVVSASQNVGKIYEALRLVGGNNWWFFVIDDNQKYRAGRFFDMNILALRLGPDFFELTITDIPLFTAVLTTSDLDSINQEQAIKLAESSTNHILGITRDEKLIGIVIAGTTRNEIFGGPSAIELYGILADLSADARVRYQAKAPPPYCLHCEKYCYQQYDIQRKAFICSNCKEMEG